MSRYRVYFDTPSGVYVSLSQSNANEAVKAAQKNPFTRMFTPIKVERKVGHDFVEVKKWQRPSASK